jgi:glycine dehydrogenase subunit 1
LQVVAGVKIEFSGVMFHELVIRLSVPVDEVLAALAVSKVQGGFSLRKAYPELGECLLICVTETKTAADIDLLVSKLKEALLFLTPAKHSMLL